MRIKQMRIKINDQNMWDTTKIVLRGNLIYSSRTMKGPM